jgi:protein-disulfide isomerase
VNLPDETSKASQIAAEVIACASANRTFWSPHDLILQEQPSWRHLPDPTDELVKLAAIRGARSAFVRDCLANHSMRGFLQGDIARARGAGVRKAPGYILDNTVLTGVRTPEEFRAAIERGLAKQAPVTRRPPAQ